MAAWRGRKAHRAAAAGPHRKSEEMTLLLRIENAAIALAALVGFYLTGASWWLFAALILAPDLSFAAYLAGPRIGAIGYNMLHSWIGPALLLAASAALGNQTF